MDFPTDRYEVVLVDPPWSYYGDQTKWGAAAKFYETQSDEWIAQLPVADILSEKNVVFLWTTSAKLEVSLSVLSSWGLSYRGVGFVWIKTRLDGSPIGAQGVRPSITKPLTEFVLVGSTAKKGRPLPLEDEGIVQTVFAPKREHSRKPDEVAERIERMYPYSAKIELFARGAGRPGWDVWGDEALHDI